MITTVDSMKLMTQANDDQLRVAIPGELKELAEEMVAKTGIKNLSQWVKLAMIEKAQRDINLL